MSDQQTERIQRAQWLYGQLLALRDQQFELIESITWQLSQPYVLIERIPGSDLIDDAMLFAIGDVLRIHHCFSKEPLSKDRFEYAFERAAQYTARQAALAPRGNPGHDITIDGQRFSLKTEAARAIRLDTLHISKFIELGKGDWDFNTQTQRYVRHMDGYDRILSFRCLSKVPQRWHYELVEIPKSLLLQGALGIAHVVEESTQHPKPFYSYVRDEQGELQYQLYFDGGTERKLQIQKLRKALCTLHATWIFTADRSDAHFPLDVG